MGILSSKHLSPLTIILVKDIVTQSQCGSTVVALETPTMEETPLSTDTLHDIHMFTTEVAGITASPWREWGTLSKDQVRNLKDVSPSLTHMNS